ncbi:MAG: PorT family protein [Massilibacteroides sp.]|nr:PorT family protein [Massilibacteroides sp.]
MIQNRNKKFICGAFILLFCLVLPVKAQISPGVLIGGSYSALSQKMDGVSQSGACFGYNIGGFVDIPFYQRLSFRPELMFASQGGNFFTQRYENEMDCNSLERVKIKNRIYSFQIPFYITYTFPVSDMNVSLLAGPALDITIAGTKSYGDCSKTLKIGSTMEDDIRPFSGAVSVGMSAEYKNLFFQISTFCGFTDRLSYQYNDESDLFQNNVYFSIGYFLR